MRIGLDAHAIGQRQTGNETYVLGLLHGFEQLGWPLDVYAFQRRAGTLHRWHRLWPRIRPVRVPVSVPLLAIRDGLDLYHGNWFLPPVLPCPGIVTVHDVTFLLHPEWFGPRSRRLLPILVGQSISRAARVITVSESAKQDIVEHYRVPPEKIVVAHLAPRPIFLEPSTPVTAGEPYFLYVGNIQPRKNVSVLVRAVANLRTRGIDVPLVIAGQGGTSYDETRSLVRELALGHLVRFTGYVSDDDLKRLYAGCTALVHPALYEGFGLTPLEAMAQGRPVIAANTGSLPEIVGDAAILVDPLDAEAWASAMSGMVENPALARSLSERGRRRAAQYSWQRCAQTTLSVYQELLEASSPTSQDRSPVRP